MISFGGRVLRKSEINYTISELECLAIIEGTRNSLTFLNSLKAGRGRLQRWALYLQEYTYTVRYKAGKLLTSDDGLSRRDYSTLPPDQVSDNDVLADENFLAAIDTTIFEDNHRFGRHRLPKTKERYTINFVYDSTNTVGLSDDTSVSDTSATIVPLSDSYDIPRTQRECPDFTHIIDYLTSDALRDNDSDARRIIAESEHYTVLDSTLYNLHRPRTKGRDRITPVVQQLCIPRTLRDEVIKAYHDNNEHVGFDKLYEAIRCKYFWPRMYAELSDYVKRCLECQQTKRFVYAKRAPHKSLPVEDVYLVTEVVDGYVYKLCHCGSRQTLPAFIYSNRLRSFQESWDKPTTDSPPHRDQSTTNETLPDSWYAITKVSNRKTIAGKIRFLVHWSDGSKSCEPENNIADAAKAAYYASCQTKRKPRDRQ